MSDVLKGCSKSKLIYEDLSEIKGLFRTAIQISKDTKLSPSTVRRSLTFLKKKDLVQRWITKRLWKNEETGQRYYSVTTRWCAK